MTGIDGLSALNHANYDCDSKFEKKEHENSFDEGVDYKMNETSVELSGKNEYVPINVSQTPFSVGN
jgi:hypothetical protein